MLRVVSGKELGGALPLAPGAAAKRTRRTVLIFAFFSPRDSEKSSLDFFWFVKTGLL